MKLHIIFMKVVGITSSFHAGSNSQGLVEEILAGAKEAGAEVELVRLAEVQINACIGCEHCKKEGNKTCFQKDGMVKIYDELATADAVVFGLPIYLGRANAPFLLLIDRRYAMI
ncbi:MAG: flavodoxin family protein [Methanocorpusculum sp.]|nr:flavodoxin family protein [Methanocorpusculum sp.]